MSDITTLNGYDLTDASYSGSTYTNYANQVSALETKINNINTYANQCKLNIDTESSTLSNTYTNLNASENLAETDYNEYSYAVPMLAESYTDANNAMSLTLSVSSLTAGSGTSCTMSRITAGIGYTAAGGTRNSLSDLTTSCTPYEVYSRYLQYGRKNITLIAVGRFMWPVYITSTYMIFQQYRIYLNSSTPYIAPARIILMFNSSSSGACTATLYSTASPLA